MQLREFLNRYSPVVTAISAVLLVGLFVYVVVEIWRGGGADRQQPTPMAYFYDQNTRELFAAPAATAVPAETPSGSFDGEPAGVRAHVYACGQCSDEAKRFIAYLSKPLPPEEQPKNEPPLDLIKRVDDSQWHRSDSPEASAILAELRDYDCKGERRNLCVPDPQ